MGKMGVMTQKYISLYLTMSTPVITRALVVNMPNLLRSGNWICEADNVEVDARNGYVKV